VNMADFKKLKRRTTLGAPPPLDEASTNLEAPELAPPHAAPTRTPSPAKSRAGQGSAKRDGRSMRRTDRTVQFATRVTPAWDEKIRQIAERDRVLLVEVLEKALEAYEAQRQ
jgi:hypothetical protein